MAVSKEANDVLDRVDTARLYDLQTELSGHEDVAEVEVRDERTPTRLRLVLDVANVSDGVNDLLDEYDAHLHPGSVMVTAEGTLAFDVSAPEGFKNAGNRDTRRYGDSSVSLTFTREALELSGFDDDTPVDLFAREDAVLMRARDS